MTFDELKALAEGEDLKYFLAPDRPTMLMGFGLLNGNFQISVALQLDGRFIQFRTVGYALCRADNAHSDALLRVLGELNYQLRLTKFGWDPTDGEVVGYADVWLEDGTLTQKQFSAILHAFLPGIDVNHPRISKTIETGEDPGEFKPEDLLAQMGASLPPELQAALAGLEEKGIDEPERPEGPEEV